MSAKKRTTIKDIAEYLKITPSSVSKALSNHPRISEKTKEAVKKAVIELNYRPNQIATALKKGKSRLIGVVVPRTNSSFFSSVVESIEEVLSEHDYKMIVTQSRESYEKECTSIDTLLQIQVDGIISSLANETTDFSHYIRIKDKGIPLVLFDRGEDEINVDYVGIDDYQSSILVVNHLVSNGCQRIAHVAGHRHTRIYEERIAGYIEALRINGLPIDKSLILESDLTIDDGRKKAQQLISSENMPDAIYAAGDFAALGVFQVLQKHRIRVPEEIALVGFSNERFTSLIKPSISSVEQQSTEIGKIAAETLLKRITDPDSVPELNKVILMPELIVRESSRKTPNAKT